MDIIEQYRKQIESMPEDERRELILQIAKYDGAPKFIPSPGPQTRAFFSKADVLLYGGEAGGGKTSLINGLAICAHRRSLVMRRQYVDLAPVIDDCLRLYGSRDGYNGSSPPSLKTDDGRVIQFGAAAQPGDEQSWKGNAHDLKAFDECVDFLEQQIRFIIGWNRSIYPGQRCRVVMATNPPVNSSGDWVIGMFRPWLDMTHPNPAKDGELRWFISDKNGKNVEVESSDPIQDGYEPDGTPKMLIPKSRTFIRSSLSDNPFLVNTDYKATLDAMPEPYRSAYRDGNFMLARKDEPNQTIPTAWVREAQARWTDKPPEGVPMCAMGVDPAAGGPDETVIATRYDGYYAKMLRVPGKDTPYPQDVAALVLRYRKAPAIPIIDCGGGYGGGVVRHLEDNGIDCKAHKGTETSSGRTKDRLYKFANKRAEVYWRFREALDPSQPGGSPIILPPDQKLLSDLTSVRHQVTSRGITLESKDEMKKRLGRSPDAGDAVVLAWSYGDTIAMHKGGKWPDGSGRKQRPQGIMGHMMQRRQYGR